MENFLKDRGFSFVGNTLYLIDPNLEFQAGILGNSIAEMKAYYHILNGVIHAVIA